MTWVRAMPSAKYRRDTIRQRFSANGAFALAAALLIAVVIAETMIIAAAPSLAEMPAFFGAVP